MVDFDDFDEVDFFGVVVVDFEEDFFGVGAGFEAVFLELFVVVSDLEGVLFGVGLVTDLEKNFCKVEVVVKAASAIMVAVGVVSFFFGLPLTDGMTGLSTSSIWRQRKSINA